MESSTVVVPAEQFFVAVDRGRYPASHDARLAHQFISSNSGVLRDFEVEVSVDYDGTKVLLVFRTGIQVGAIPLRSPTSGFADYGLVTYPRFDWVGLGMVLSQTGWKIRPNILPLSPLPQSDRRIPLWVLSGTVLLRLEALIKSLQRKFVVQEKELLTPRGQINWDAYCRRNMTRMHLLEVPCRIPDLEDDHLLKGSIHFALKKQLRSLESQREAGIVVIKLIEFCKVLLSNVQNATPKIPSIRQLQTCSKVRMNQEVFKRGLEAIEWTVEDRGLAGVSDLRGLPWMMSMDEFYESWVETVLEVMTRKNGAVLKSGRKRETIRPIVWDKPFVGSQKFLLPDFIVEHPEGVIVVDAKYKDHWEDMQVPWFRLDQDIRDLHRHDLHQILGYSSLFDRPIITACLVYPCRGSTWLSLIQRQQVCRRASIHAGTRRIDLLLTTFPFSRSADEVAAQLAQEFFRSSFLN